MRWIPRVGEEVTIAGGDGLATVVGVVRKVSKTWCGPNKVWLELDDCSLFVQKDEITIHEGVEE